MERVTEPLRGGAGRKPKFKVGQVVAMRSVRGGTCDIVARVKSFDGVFYRLDIKDGELDWREDELRSLTKREKGKP